MIFNSFGAKGGVVVPLDRFKPPLLFYISDRSRAVGLISYLC